MKPYKELFLNQGSDEWLLARRNHITATDIGKILGKNPYSSAIDCYDEKINGKTTPVNDAMLRGQELEIKARKFLAIRDGVKWSPKCFESVEYPFLMASLDCVSPNNSMGKEIKCPLEKAMAKALEGNYDKYHLWQLNTQMLSMGWDSIVLQYYYSDFIDIEFEIKRDEKLIKKIIEAGKNFWHNNLLVQTPPEKYGDEYERIKDTEATKLAMRWQELTAIEKEAKEKKEKVVVELEQYTKGKSCIFSDAGLRHQVIERKGSVDWSQVKLSYSIKEEELEAFRKEKSSFSKFSDI